MLDSGSLDRLVRIERRERDEDELGQPLDRWVPIATVWANVRMLTGKETIRADAVVGEASASIRIRFRRGLETGMRAVLLRFEGGEPVDDEFFEILKPLPDYGSRGYTDLVCKTEATHA